MFREQSLKMNILYLKKRKKIIHFKNGYQEKNRIVIYHDKEKFWCYK